MRVAVAIGLLWVVGCGGKDTGVLPSAGTTSPTGTATATGTGTGTGTGTTTTTSTLTTLSPEHCEGVPTDWRRLPIQSSEDFTISADGLLYGVSISTGALMRSDHAGNFEVLAPSISSWGRGTRFLPGGDLIVAVPETGTLERFDHTTWSHVAIVNGMQEPNGVAIGDDGIVYATQMNGRVVRVDPDTNQGSILYETPVSTDGITFAPNYRDLYWNSEGGQVIWAELDDEGAIVGGPAVHANLGSGGFTLLDGMTGDACGNLYVVEMFGRIHRVFPDGSSEVFLDLSNQGVFISAVNFGTGAGGFEDTWLYVMDLNGGVFEIETDIPRNWEPHL